VISTVTTNKYVQAIGFIQPGSETKISTDSSPSSMSSTGTDAVSISNEGQQASLISTRLLSGLKAPIFLMASKENLLALTSQTENKLQKLYEQMGLFWLMAKAQTMMLLPRRLMMMNWQTPYVACQPWQQYWRPGKNIKNSVKRIKKIPLQL